MDTAKVIMKMESIDEKDTYVTELIDNTLDKMITDVVNGNVTPI